MENLEFEEFEREVADIADILIFGKLPVPELRMTEQKAEMASDLKRQQEILRVQTYALQVKQFFLKLDPSLAKLFAETLTSDPNGDWRKLFDLLDKVPDTPLKKLSPTYEFSKEYSRVLQSGGTFAQAIQKGRVRREQAIAFNKRSEQKQLTHGSVPLLPGATEKKPHIKCKARRGEAGRGRARREQYGKAGAVLSGPPSISAGPQPLPWGATSNV